MHAPVLHFCMPHQVRDDAGSSSTSTTRCSRRRASRLWIAHNLRHDRVVVPSAFCEAAWVESGLPRERIGICPLGVDAERFHPPWSPSTSRTGAGGRCAVPDAGAQRVETRAAQEPVGTDARVDRDHDARGRRDPRILKLSGAQPAGVLRLPARHRRGRGGTSAETRRESARRRCSWTRSCPTGTCPPLCGRDALLEHVARGGLGSADDGGRRGGARAHRRRDTARIPGIWTTLSPR